MAQQFEGIVTQVSQKPWPDRETGKEITLHSFKVDASDKWYRTGERNPNLKKGDFIQFAADFKNNVRVDSINNRGPKAGAQETEAPAAQEQAGARASYGRSRGSSSAGSRDDYWKEKEQRDIEKEAKYQAVDVPRMSYSAAQDRAVALVSAALAHDGLSFGTTAKGKKLDLILEFVDQVTDRFFLQSFAAADHLKALQQEAAYNTDAESEPEVLDE